MAQNRKLIAGVAAVALSGMSFAQDQGEIKYPDAKRSDVTDTYHGITVQDPYRWLEDANSADTKAWVKAENALTFGYLKAIPERGAIEARIKKLYNYARQGMPTVAGPNYFYTKNTGLQNQPPLYVKAGSKGKERLLLDPNALSKDGTVALGTWEVTQDGNRIAYSIQRAGSDWLEWKVRDVATGKDLSDHIMWSKFSGASWTKDGSGFYYSRYAEPQAGTKLQVANYYQKLYFHKIGTPQSSDKLIYERKDHKDWGFGGTVSEDGKYLLIYVSKGTDPNVMVFVQRLDKKNAPIIEVLNKFDAEYSFLGNVGTKFWFKTNKNAPNSRVVVIDINKPEKANWKTVVPEAKEPLNEATLVGGRIFASYLKDAQSVIEQFDPSGKSLGRVKLPGIGTAGGFGGKASDKETFYTFSSFTFPTRVYKMVLPSGKASLFWKPNVALDSSNYETKQVFYTSKDGTKVPMFLTYKKGMELDGMNPTLLYGYGGFRIPLTPGFSPVNAVWLEMGGVYAMANLRGGLEYGEAWHEGGMKLKKQNVFDDFIAAGEWLIENHYTSTSRLAINGGSNGGLLVGAVLNQRPDLFGAAVPEVGVMDMLRFNKFTIGWAWMSDYGSPDNEAEFKALRAYSPYHNVRTDVAYPPTLVMTADTDDRVVPAHSFKYAAAMQNAQTGHSPILIRIETSAGHGGGKPISKTIEERADVFAFLLKSLDFGLPEDFGK